MQSLSSSYLELGSIFVLNNEIDSSLYYTYKGQETARAANLFSIEAEANTQLAAIYKLQNKPDQAITFLQKAKTLTDSLNYSYIDKLIQFQNIGFDEQLKLVDIEKEQIVYQNRIRTYSFLTVLGIFLIAGLVLYRNNRLKIKANKKLEKTLSNLKATQSQLIQSEKMASLGELTAGIAHEIQNPLNFVNNFSEVSGELIDELKAERSKLKARLPDGQAERDESLEEEILNDITQNLQKINHHGQRASGIVKGMLEHSRTSTGKKELTDINAIADEYLRLAYHGLRAKDKSFNADFKTEFDDALQKVNVISQDIGRVLLNLINNAFYAVNKKAKEGIEGYKPKVIVSTKLISPSGGGQGEVKVQISVKDNGDGIPTDLKDKIFQPFFTTKPSGEGTGLGLSLSYDIIKAHGGKLELEMSEEVGSTFIILIPTT
jgi:signal transduction histidine kinase